VPLSRWEAASLLGVAADAGPDEVQRAYASRLAVDPGNTGRREALNAALHVMLPRSRWVPPGPSIAPPPAPAAAGAAAYPGAAFPGPAHHPDSTSRRRRGRTRFVLGGSIGGAAGLIVALTHLISGPAFSSGTAAPFHSATSHASHGSEVLDGVSVRYSGSGWTFILTSNQDCPAAKVVVGFGDTPDGDPIDQFTDSVPLTSGTRTTYTVPDSTSRHPYAVVDEIVCHAM
jgi:hypothetical protein